MTNVTHNLLCFSRLLVHYTVVELVNESTGAIDR